MRWKYVICGFLVLLAGAYLDNIRGPLLPVLTHLFHLHYGTTTWFLVAGNFGALAGIFLLIPATQNYTERQVAFAVCFFTLLTAFFANWVGGFFSLILFATFLGVCISLLGAICNLFVIKGTDSSTRARAMCGLHMMYGIGSLIAPSVAGRMIDFGLAWQIPVEVVSLLVLIILVFLSLMFSPGESVGVVVKQTFRFTRIQILIVIVFAIYVAGEVMCSMWMVTYLVEWKKLSLTQSSPYIGGFFLMMGITRGLCFFSLREKNENVVMVGALTLSILFFSLGHFGWRIGFSLAGVLGPFFPLFLARTSRVFPEQWRSLTLWILAGGQIAQAFAYILVGRFIDLFGIEKAYWTPGILLGSALLIYLVCMKRWGDAPKEE